MSAADRYAPEVPFPPYGFLPGTDPHPSRDPRGHSFGAPETPAPYAPADAWRDNQAYLYGVDLYNHGYLWEAHEAWESLWHPSKHDETLANYVQGLIQCAAACLKVPMGQPTGMARLSALGTGRLERVGQASGGTYMGLEVFDFVASMRAFAASAPESVETRPVIALDVEGVTPPEHTPLPRPQRAR